MRINPMPVYQKGQVKKNGNRPTTEQKRRWSRLVAMGCAIPACNKAPNIHHCHTGAGGRKDHDKVLPLCEYHHQGEQGIHRISRRVWQEIYGTEDELMRRMDSREPLPV